MRHLYRCPVRWADLDLLGHVNNVVFVDYLQEARVDLMRTVFARPPGADADDLAEGVVVVRHEVTYLQPMGLRFAPVSVECWVTEVRAASFALAYEVFHDDPDLEGGRRVYLRARTNLTPYVFAAQRPRRLTTEEKALLAPYVESAERRPTTDTVRRPDRASAFHYAAHVRFSDVDVYRHVNNVTYFEYLQESRIRHLADLTRGTDVAPPAVVVAQADVDYRRPILLRREAYDVWAGITRLGSRSMTIESEIADDDEVLARSRVTLVFFDFETQRSAEPTPGFRALVEASATRRC